MTTRSLAFLVLSLVLGTALTVGWYLEGERTASAAERAPDARPRIEHVWRTYPAAVSTRRSRSNSGSVTSTRLRSHARPGRMPTLGTPAVAPSAGADESTTFRRQIAD